MLILALLLGFLQSADQMSDHSVVRSYEECPSCHLRGQADGLAFHAEVVLAAKLVSLGETAVFEIQDASLSPGTAFSDKSRVCITDKTALDDLQTALMRPEVDSKLWLLSGHVDPHVTWHQPVLITERDFQHIVAAKTFLKNRSCDEKVCTGLVEALLDRKSRLHFAVCAQVRDLCLDSPNEVLLRAKSMPHQLLHKHVSDHQSAGPSDGVSGETSGVSEYLLCAMLVACANADDDALILDRIFDERRIDSLVTPEAAVAIFLQSRGEGGMALVENRLVSYAVDPTLSTLDANRRRGWVGGVINGIDAVRKSGSIPKERLRGCIAKLLARKEYLPTVVRMIVTLEDWSQGDVIAEHFKTGVKDSVGILLADYMHKVSIHGSDSQVRSARQTLESIKKTHPQIFETARQRYGWKE